MLLLTWWVVTSIEVFPIVRIIEAGRALWRVVLIRGGSRRRRSGGGGGGRRLREIRRLLLGLVVKIRTEISEIGVTATREELTILKKFVWQRRRRKRRRRRRHGWRTMALVVEHACVVHEIPNLTCLLLDALGKVEFSLGAFEPEGCLIIGEGRILGRVECA